MELFKLKTAMMVDEDQARTALRAFVHERLYGIDLKAGDEVVLTGAKPVESDQGIYSSARASWLSAGALGVVYGYSPPDRYVSEGSYDVAVLDSEGELAICRLNRNEIAPREAADAPAAL